MLVFSKFFCQFRVLISVVDYIRDVGRLHRMSIHVLSSLNGLKVDAPTEVSKICKKCVLS